MNLGWALSILGIKRRGKLDRKRNGLEKGWRGREGERGGWLLTEREGSSAPEELRTNGGKEAEKR